MYKVKVIVMNKDTMAQVLNSTAIKDTFADCHAWIEDTIRFYATKGTEVWYKVAFGGLSYSGTYTPL
jgi:hypothetical protein